MPGYAIYIPGKPARNASALEAVGLHGLCKESGPEFADILAKGPDGGSGLLATWRKVTDNGGLTVGEYTWKPAKADKARGLAAKRFWVGVPHAGLTPQSLERKTQYRGYGMLLADGNRWAIPPAVNLPHQIGLDDDGEPRRFISDEWRPYWERCEQFAAEFLVAIDSVRNGATETKLTLKDTWQFACEALSINYRLCSEVIDLLGLVNEDAAVEVVKAAIDLPVLAGIVPSDKDTFTIQIP